MKDTWYSELSGLGNVIKEVANKHPLDSYFGGMADISVYNIFDWARKYVVDFNNNALTVLHIIYAYAVQKPWIITDYVNVTKSFPLSIKNYIKNYIEEIYLETEVYSSLPTMNPVVTKQLEKIFKISVLEATLLKSKIVFDECIILSILRDEDNEAAKVLKYYGITYDEYKKAFEAKMNTPTKTLTEGKETKRIKEQNNTPRPEHPRVHYVQSGGTYNFDKMVDALRKHLVQENTTLTIDDLPQKVKSTYQDEYQKEYLKIYRFNIHDMLNKFLNNIQISRVGDEYRCVSIEPMMSGMGSGGFATTRVIEHKGNDLQFAVVCMLMDLWREEYLDEVPKQPDMKVEYFSSNG